MFSLKVFRLKAFNNKIVLNPIKLNQINSKYISNSVKVNQKLYQTLRTSSAVKNTNHKTSSKSLSEKSSERDILENVFTLSKNVSIGNRSIDELISESDFRDICDKIEDKMKFLTNYQLINCIHSLLTMGLDPNTKIIQTLENQLLWKSRVLSLKELLECLSFHVRYQSTEQQKKVVNELIVNLVLKLDKTSDSEDIVHLLSLWRFVSPEVIERIEMTAIDMIGSNDIHFDVNSLSYILVLLSQMNRRTKPLITAVVNRFTYYSVSAEKYNEKKIIKMISALNKLNYPDIHFLRKASDLLCNKKFLNTVGPSDRKDLLVAISQLNWSYPRLLDQFVEKITDTTNDFSSQDFLVLVSTFARLNYRSVYLNDILSHYVIPYVKEEELDSEAFLLYVWSLSLLGSVPLRCIHSVLNQQFYDKLMSESNQSSIYKQNSSKLKLLNIKAVAEIEMKAKIDFNPFSISDYEMPKKEVKVEKFKKSIVKTLHSFVPNLSTNVLTPYGFAIDAEFIVDKNLESLPIKGFSLMDINDDNRLAALPEGYTRCALMCFGFNDTLLNDSGFIGVRELSIRLLKRLGYNVILVTENDCPMYLKDHQKCDKLKSIINNENEIGFE